MAHGGTHWRQAARERAGWTLISTLLFLAAGALILTVLLNGWWTANQATVVSTRVLQARAQSQAAVAYGVWWLEQDPAATQLNTSTPSATLSVPPPANTPAGSVTLQLQDPVAAIAINDPVAVTSTSVTGPSQPSHKKTPHKKPSHKKTPHQQAVLAVEPATLTAAATLTVQTGTTWALNAVGTDSSGNTVSLQDVTLNWSAVGTGSTPGAVSWVAPGVFQATTAGTVAITVPSVTTAGGQTLPVTSSSLAVSITSGPPGTGAGLQVSPTPLTLTLGAQQPLTAVYTAAAGTESSVTTCSWSVASGSSVVSLAATSTGATVTAQEPGSATVACTDTPSGSSSEIATTAITVVDPVRIVRLTPDGAPPDAAVAVTVQVQGATAKTVRWTGP